MRISSYGDQGREADARCLDPKTVPSGRGPEGFSRNAFMSISPNCLRAYSAAPAV